MSNSASEASVLVNPRDEAMIRTIKSFGNRWGVLGPILCKHQGDGNGYHRAKGKLEKQHAAAISSLLPGLSKEKSAELLAEILMVDSALLSDFYNGKFRDIDAVRQSMERMLAPSASKAGEEKPAATEPETSAPASLANTQAPPQALSPAEEEEQFQQIMAVLALHCLTERHGLSRELKYGHTLECVIQSVDGRMRAEEVCRFAEYVKMKAGEKLHFRIPDDVDDDIPF